LTTTTTAAPTTAHAILPLGKDERWGSITRPTAGTRFLRVFLPWQLVRFVLINLRMIRIIAMGHHRQPPS
jgi:hypothetical protein